MFCDDGKPDAEHPKLRLPMRRRNCSGTRSSPPRSPLRSCLGGSSTSRSCSGSGSDRRGVSAPAMAGRPRQTIQVRHNGAPGRPGPVPNPGEIWQVEMSSAQAGPGIGQPTRREAHAAIRRAPGHRLPGIRARSSHRHRSLPGGDPGGDRPEPPAGRDHRHGRPDHDDPRRRSAPVRASPPEATGAVPRSSAPPAHAARDPATVFFSPYYKAPLGAPCPTVVTIHDLIPVTFPAYTRGWRRGFAIAFRLWATLLGRRATAVITDSEYSKGEIARRLGIPAVPNPCDAHRRRTRVPPRPSPRGHSEHHVPIRHWGPVSPRRRQLPAAQEPVAFGRGPHQAADGRARARGVGPGRFPRRARTGAFAEPGGRSPTTG